MVNLVQPPYGSGLQSCEAAQLCTGSDFIAESAIWTSHQLYCTAWDACECVWVYCIFGAELGDTTWTNQQCLHATGVWEGRVFSDVCRLFMRGKACTFWPVAAKWLVRETTCMHSNVRICQACMDYWTPLSIWFIFLLSLHVSPLIIAYACNSICFSNAHGIVYGHLSPPQYRVSPSYTQYLWSWLMLCYCGSSLPVPGIYAYERT